jgi:hypothetical protein
MSAQSNKARKKQQRSKKKHHEMVQRKKRQLLAKKSTLDDSSPPNVFSTPAVDDIESIELDESRQDNSPLGIWWREYQAADGETRLQMVREKLDVIPSDHEDYKQLFPEAVSELEAKLSCDTFVSFLEELASAHPDVFAMNADWHTRSMVFEYLAQNRMQDIDRVVSALAAKLKEIDSPFFSLVSTLRLSGSDAAQSLIDAAFPLIDDAELMYWAVGEIHEWALFPSYQRCIAAGASGDSLDALRLAVARLGIEDSPEYQEDRHEFAMHLSGQSAKQWTRSELLARDDDTPHKVFLLNADFMCWLCEERKFKPIVADELRHLAGDAINEMDGHLHGIMSGLSRRDVEPYVTSKLGFMSLKRIHAPATVVVLAQYVDFLKEIELTKPSDWKKSRSACASLWYDLPKALGDEWPQYQFLEAYLPT